MMGVMMEEVIQKTKMSDIFDNVVVCSKCKKKMNKDFIIKDGFKIRVLVCPECKQRILHPSDLAEYEKFKKLKQRHYSVKLRIVGNSYTVSIPKEIISFMREQEMLHRKIHGGFHRDFHKDFHKDMVKLCFEDFGRLSLIFGETEKFIKNKFKEMV